MAQDNNNIDIKYYAQIIEYFETESDPEEQEFWKYKTLIKLMEELKQAKATPERIKNSIIIMHALFDKNDSPDEFTARGINTAELNNEDKEICHAQLRKELLIQ